MYDAWGSHSYIAVLCCDCITNEPLLVNYSTILNEAETGGASPNSLVYACVCLGVDSCIRMPLAFGILSPPYRMETPSREAHSAVPVIKSAVCIAEVSAGPATITHTECKSYFNYGVTVLYAPICTQQASGSVKPEYTPSRWHSICSRIIILKIVGFILKRGRNTCHQKRLFSVNLNIH